MQNLAIMGIGLMGGSLGLAARARGVAGSITGYARREEARRSAVDGGVVDAAFAAPGDAVADADLVVFCMPVLTIRPCLAECRSSLKPGCVVTDVGSTKHRLVQELELELQESDAAFVGSHPIAGSHQTGMQAARTDLYDGATVVVTPGRAPGEAVEAVETFWTRLGSRVVRMDAEEHDRLVARSSHLPHLVAAALVEAVCADAPSVLPALFGTGFRDTSRIAAGSEDVWHDILSTNRESVLAELDRFGKEITGVRQMLAEEDFRALRNYLGRCRELRRGLD